MRRVAGVVAGVAVLAAGAGARASDWTVTVGGRIQGVTPYEGAGHVVVVPVPSIQIRRPSSPDRPTFPGDALGVTLLRMGPLTVGPAARIRGRRTAVGDRQGLDEIATGLEAGAFANLWPTEFIRLHADGGKGFSGHSGWVGDLAADLVVRPGRWTLTAGPRIGFGSADYMRTYFGVSPLEALANEAIRAEGGSAYEPGGGRRYVGAVGTLIYKVSGRWEGTANFSYHRLSAAATNSPVVRALGEANEYAGGVGFRYSFGVTP